MRLKEERLRIGMSVDDFAKAGGVSRTTQFAYENGSRQPDAAYLARLWLQERLNVHFVVTGDSTAASLASKDISAPERTLLNMYTPLPMVHRDFVEKAAILAHLAWRDHGATIGGFSEAATAH